MSKYTFITGGVLFWLLLFLCCNLFALLSMRSKVYKVRTDIRRIDTMIIKERRISEEIDVKKAFMEKPNRIQMLAKKYLDGKFTNVSQLMRIDSISAKEDLKYIES